MTGCREAGHVDAHLGHHHLGDGVAHAGHGFREFGLGPKGAEDGVQFLLYARDGLLEGTNLVEVKPEQESMMRRHAAPQRFDDLIALGPQPVVGQCRERSRVGLPRDNGLEEGASALAQDVGDDRGDQRRRVHDDRLREGDGRPHR